MKEKDKKENALGRGLSSLLPSDPKDAEKKGFCYIDVSTIDPNPFQPRINIPISSLIELSESIKEKGVVSPITVTPSMESDERYVLVAGERRMKAAKLAGFKEVPAIVRDMSDQEMAEVSLIENVHRKDLNPVEEGYAIFNLMGEFGLTTDQIARKLSKTKGYLDNKVLLTRLPNIIQNALINGEITEYHARALGGLKDEEAMVAALKIVLRNGLNSKKTEELVRQIKVEKDLYKKTSYSPTLEWESKFNYIKDEISSNLGWSTKLKKNRKSGGSLVIEFQSDDELVSIYKYIIDKDAKKRKTNA